MSDRTPLQPESGGAQATFDVTSRGVTRTDVSAADQQTVPADAEAATDPRAACAYVDDCVQRIGGGQSNVIPLLQAVQDRFHYLPEAALERISQRADTSASIIEGVASFYKQFRRKPAGRCIIRICHGTACHVKGSQRIEDAWRRVLGIPDGADTDASGRFTIEPVACIGVCTSAPAAQVGERTYGHLRADDAAGFLTRVERQHSRQANGEQQRLMLGLPPNASGVDAHDDVNTHALTGGGRSGTQPRVEVRIGLGSCCLAKGSGEVFDAMANAAAKCGGDAVVKAVGCVGMCHRTPMVDVRVNGNLSLGVRPHDSTGADASGAVERPTLYAELSPDDALRLLDRHATPRTFGNRVRRWVRSAGQRIDAMLSTPARSHRARPLQPIDHGDGAAAFLGPQVHIATEGFGDLHPLDLEEYQRTGGFDALRRCAAGEFSAEQIIDSIDAGGLRGRGGAGFATARKWRLVHDATAEQKYVICNGDEGDPGAFMDRMLLESFPYRVIEGMAIAAIATGARQGIFYIRHEYPLAVARVREALARCEAAGVIGPNVMGCGPAFTLRIVEGAGAFVCGEETALIASIEGRRGEPRIRPPYPVESGLWGRPTLVNNVETLSMVPWIIRRGPEAFRAIGSTHSAGTKVFALAGKVRRGGLIEAPMGMTIRRIVEDIGGGVAPGRTFKAVQIGGPSGGCLPASLADTPVDYEALRDVGAIMGSGGLVVLDDQDCMVDIARYFLQFTQSESCGKCTFCRIGTRRMLEILERLCVGQGQPRDLDDLQQLAEQVSASSLCGLGKTAPNPVASTLRYFRDEYEAHLRGECPAGKCKALVRYAVNDRCIGCTICAQICPVDAIAMTPYQRHAIDVEACTQCDACRTACPEAAIDVRTGQPGRDFIALPGRTATPAHATRSR